LPLPTTFVWPLNTRFIPSTTIHHLCRLGHRSSVVSVAEFQIAAALKWNGIE
ncbi:hypothetical protein Ancab_022827, partial [Ancistrocladus abbreviatus]